MNFLRCIFVLPAGMLAALLIAFPIHWILMFTFGGFGRANIITLDAATLADVERFLMGIFAPFAFCCGAAATAPSYRKVVAIISGVVLIIGVYCLIPRANDLAADTGKFFEYSIVNFFSHLFGIIGGFLYVRHKYSTETHLDM